MALETIAREEIGRRGQEMYETRLRSLLETEDNIGKIVSIDVDSGDYEIADDLLVAGKRPQLRRPDAQMYGRRIGYNAVYAVGGSLAPTLKLRYNSNMGINAMKLDTITREEFDRRLEAANARLAQELQQREEQQAQAEQLLTHYERALSEIEIDLENIEQEAPAYSVRLRKKLTELAEKTASVAASL